MKRIVFLAMLFALVCNVSMAQDKPTKGSFSTEVNFKPFESNGNMFSLEDGYAFKVRYFLNEESALRFKLGFARDAKTNNVDLDLGGYSADQEVSARWGDFSLSFGYERHFNMTKRINFYVGGELGFYRHFASMEGEISLDGAKFDFEFSNMIPDENSLGGIINGLDHELQYLAGMFKDPIEQLGAEPGQAYWGVAANAFAGLDFYVYKGFYIGSELGLNIKSHKTSDREIKYSATDLGSDKITSVLF